MVAVQEKEESRGIWCTVYQRICGSPTKRVVDVDVAWEPDDWLFPLEGITGELGEVESKDYGAYPLTSICNEAPALS